MRTKDEIRARVASEMDADPSGILVSMYVDALDGVVHTDGTALRTMYDYFASAAHAADEHMGLTALANVQRYNLWVWFLDNHALTDAYDAAKYTNYGAPKLQVVRDYLMFNGRFPYIPTTLTFDRMAKGDRCRPYCTRGCDRKVMPMITL